ncbi:uncharacterized protein LOC117168427 [Belonocnema kinseyi]|uniref:uncharacterized protein LOC117168427 n=1 Tax=Belonocnema kinseyi TaxID=2817044 RepID=UPI00143DF688|nr:uncharacterized protein LOC117168427 [Belonocnema kinseyi]
MKVWCAKFIDSLNYLHMPLSKQPKAFGLNDIKKGTFSHLFNTPDHIDYKGPLPASECYSTDTISEEARKEFLEWYETLEKDSNYVFDFKKEIVEYCIADVTILRRACVAFRDIFKKCANVCPFSESVAIASACSRVHRKSFLTPDTIGIIPAGGYRRANNQSAKAIEWLLWCERELGREIRHAGHPKIFVGDECKNVTGVDFKNLGNLEGLVKCRVLPP